MSKEEKKDLFAGNNLYETKQLCQRYIFFDNFSEH